MVVRNEVNDVMSYKRQCQEGGKKWAGRKVERDNPAGRGIAQKRLRARAATPPCERTGAYREEKATG